MTTAQDRALDWSLLITACNKNDRENMHTNLGNLIYTERKTKFTATLLEQLDSYFKDVSKKSQA